MKDWHYCLKGGVVAVVALIVLIFVTSGYILLLPLTYLFIPLVYWIGGPPSIYGIYLASAMSWFLAGALLGGIYGKIKNRNKATI